MTIQYDPQKVTDWLTPLEKVYARQSRQLDTYHAQLRERDRQEEAATLDLPEMFGKLASFSQTIGSVVEARKANIKAEDKKKLRLAKVKWLDTIKDTDKPEATKLIKWRTDEGNLKSDFSIFKNKVNEAVKLGRLSPEAGKTLLDQHGANIVYYQQILAQQKIDNGIDIVNSGFKGNEERQRKWRDLEATNDTQGKKSYIEKYLFDEVSDLNISEELFAEKFINQISELTNTKGILSKIKIKDNLLTADNFKFAKRIDLVRKQGGNLADEISKQIKESSKDNVFLNLFSQAATGDLKDYELADMRNGYVKHDAGDIIVTEKNKKQYPGFDVGDKLGKGELLFTDKDGASKWHQLEAQVNAYNKAIYDASVAANETTLTNAIVGIKQGNIKADQKDQILSTYIKNGGKTSDDLYKEFEKAQKSDPVVAQIEQERIGEIQLTGRPGQYEGEVENMSQVDFEKWKKDKEAYEANREQNGFGKTTSDDLATNIMTNKLLGLDISIAGKKLTPGTQEEIRDFISAKADKLYMKHYLNPEAPRDQIDELTETDLNNWLTSKGAFVKATDTENADFGILTSDGQGGFPGWEAQQQSKIERTKGTNPQRTVRNVLNEFQEHKTLTNLLNKGRGITNAELLAVVDNIKDGKLTAFPPDVLLKARIYGKQPSALIVSKLEYLEKTKDTGDKNFVKRFDLDPKTVKNLKEQLANSPDIQIRKVLEGINDGRTLLSYYNKRNIGGLSPNQLNYIIREADKQRVTAQKEKEELEKEIEETKKMQQPDTQIGRYNTRS
jgi:ribosomal protein L27